jgi:transcriptional regulator with XRE-family HTH domain
MVADDINHRIAERLRSLRHERGLSLGELAELSRVSKAMIDKIETSRSSPTAGALGRLCSGLGITMSALMAAIEAEDATQLLAADQSKWPDPETRLERMAVYPRTPSGAVEIARSRAVGRNRRHLQHSRRERTARVRRDAANGLGVAVGPDGGREEAVA